MKLASKRLGLGAAALLTMAGVALVAPNVASAHHVDITGSTTCRDAEGNYPVTWTVNHPGTPDWGGFRGDGGIVIAPGGSWTTTTTGSGDQAVLSVSGYFDKNGNEQQDEGDPTWSAEGSVDEPEQCQPTKPTPTPPTYVPVCGPENDTVSVPDDSEDVSYEVTDWVNGQRTVTAYWTDDDSELDSWTFTDASEPCPEENTTTTTQPPTTTTQPPTRTEPASLDIAAIGPVCLRDAPYIEMTFGNQPEFNGQPATVTFVDLDGNAVETQTATYQAGTTVRFVYPGASVDAAGNPLDWPGWVFDGDEWVTDPSDARLRDGLTVVVGVNPTATATVSYPPETAACANPPTVRDPATPQGSLPQTGSSTGPMAVVATGLLMAGGAALLATRRSAASR